MEHYCGNELSALEILLPLPQGNNEVYTDAIFHPRGISYNIEVTDSRRIGYGQNVQLEQKIGLNKREAQGIQWNRMGKPNTDTATAKRDFNPIIQPKVYILLH